jgi:hypothetical protein
MVSFLLLALLAAAPVAQLSEEELDGRIAAAHPLALSQRIDRLSAMFLGTSYADLPLGDDGGPEPGLRWRVDKVDCQTFVETVLAMANAHSLEQAKSILDDIRYAKPPPSFDHRNHFTEAQWLPVNTGKGYLKDEVPRIEGRAPTSILTLHKEQWSKVPALQRLARADIPEGKFMVRYLPIDELEGKAKSLHSGSVIFVVRADDPNRVVRISHMGFLLRGPEGWFVRHATSGEKYAVVDEPLREYVQRAASYQKWKVVGFALARPLDASQRVARLASR